MDANDAKLPPEHLQSLLLQFKYHTAIRRVAKGVTHNYNNIFTGLGGQTSILRQESALPCDTDCKRGELIDDLLQRGIDQTAILYDFARDMDTVNRSHSPLLLATKTLELLNSISRVHRFVLKSELRQEKVVCNLRDVVLILFYLGENCVDATPEGGKIILEIVRMQNSESTEPQFAFCFRDHGPGFAESILSSLHVPFATTRCDSPHRGLGLYAADVLARRYHGRLIIADRDREETVVSAVFPVNTEEAVEPIHTEQPRTGKHGGNGPGKQCFLVVEDDEAMRTLLLHRLQRRGHMVFCVNTCAEALEEYEPLHDIITTVLMDVGLRDSSGYECQRKILKINPQARIIFMSGQLEKAPRGIAGKTAFLQKPFTLSQLEEAIQE